MTQVWITLGSRVWTEYSMGFMEKGEGNQQVLSANCSRHTSCSSIEPSNQIISDDFVDEGEIIPELNAEEATDVSCTYCCLVTATLNRNTIK